MIYKIQSQMLKQEKKAAFILLLLSALSIAAALTLSRDSEAALFGNKSSCSCLFTGKKNYIRYEETQRWRLFGSVRHVDRAWTCEYNCKTPSGTGAIVTGSYALETVGKDNGLEGICEGTVYESQYNTYVGDFAYSYKRSETFDPARSESDTLVRWAEKYCPKGV